MEMCHGSQAAASRRRRAENLQSCVFLWRSPQTRRASPQSTAETRMASALRGSAGRCCWGHDPPLRSDLGHQCWDQTSWHPTLLRALRSPQHTPVPLLTALRDLRRPAELVRAAGGFWGQTGVGLEGLGATHCLGIQLRAQTFTGLTGSSAASGTSSSWGFYDPF